MVPSFEIKIKDTAGSGDWTSVGLISRLLHSGKRDLEKRGKREISSALSYAQALAAMNCQFEGPRGAMYHMTPTRFLDAVKSLGANKPEVGQDLKHISLAQNLSTAAVCPACNPGETKSPEERHLRSLAAKTY